MIYFIKSIFYKKHFDKANRNLIYVHVLNNLCTTHSFFSRYFCPLAMKYISEKHGISIDEKNMKYEFPELYKYRTSKSNIVWFEVLADRIYALERAIELTK